MLGLYLLLILGLWICFAFFISKMIVENIIKPKHPFIVKLLIITVLLPLPLIDEIIGARQFEKLCQENSIQVNREKARGRTVYLAGPEYVEIKGTMVRITARPWRLLDATTDELVVSYNRLHASGGWLVHTFGFSEGRVPLTFKGTCGSFYPVKTLREIEVTRIERKDLEEFRHKETK